MHGLTVYVKEGVPFKWVLSLENSADSYLSFQLVLLHSLSHFFFLFRSPSSFLCAVFGSLSSNFVFGDFNVHHTDWLTYFDGTDRPGELCYNFSISNDLTYIAYDYSQADWDGFCNHLRDAPWEDIFKLGSSAAAS